MFLLLAVFWLAQIGFGNVVARSTTIIVAVSCELQTELPECVHIHRSATPSGADHRCHVS
jgi:hypothetical protein